LIGFSLWAPIAAIYFSDVSGSYVLGLSIFSIAMLSSALFEIPTGIFSDLIGRKNTTMLGGLFYTLAMIFYALGFSYLYLVIGALFEGLARSLYSGNNDALLYDSLKRSNKEDELERFMGFIGSAEQWTLGISALVGGIIAAYSFKLVMWLSVIPLFLCFISSILLVEVKERRQKGEGNIYLHLKAALQQFVTNPKLRLLSLSSISGYGLGEAAFQFRSVFVASLWPIWAIGLSRTISNITAAIGFGLSGKIIEKFNAAHILFFERIYSKTVNFISLIFPTPASPALMSTTSVLYGPSMVAENSLFQKEFNDKQRATMGSFNSFGKSLTFGLSALLLGLLADLFNPRHALIAGQILELFSVWLTWKLLKLIRTGTNPRL